MLLPCDQPYLRASVTQRSTYPVEPNDLLPVEVEKHLLIVLTKELKLAADQEKLKQELAARYDCDIRGLFKEVDDINYNYVDAANLKRFLVKTGFYAKDH